MAPILVFTSLFFIGCEEKKPPPPPPPPAPPAAEPEQPAKEAEKGDESPHITLFDSAGKPELVLHRREDGNYKLTDGDGKKIGKAKVEMDRVKVKDTTGTLRAKVKKKENGFKLLGGDEKAIFKAKIKGENKIKLKNDADEELGVLKGRKGTLKGTALVAKEEAGLAIVEKDGKPLLKVKMLAPEPALLLAYPGLDRYQKAGILIFVSEVL